MRGAIPLLLLLTHCAPGPGAPGSNAPGSTAVVAGVGSEPSAGISACEPAPFPETPAGQRLEQLVAAMNAPDASAAEVFITTAMAPGPRSRYEGFIRANAGDELTLALCRVEFSGAAEVAALVGGVDVYGRPEYGVVVLSVDGNGTVASLGVMRATEQDLARPGEPLDDEGVRRVVEGMAEGVSGYVFADEAAQMAARLRTALESGEYAGVTSGHVLAHRLAGDLFAVTHDEHLDVTYQAPVPEPPPEEIASIEERAAQDNYGMPVAEIREGNVGYLKVVGFVPPPLGADAVSATMSKLAAADVLVIDLRDNGGGSPHGVALMASYLFGDTRVHLNDLYNRKEDHTESFYTSPDVPGRRYGVTKPIYVLTSAYTFSAGEEFAYDLQALGRATIVGEVTGGGAHPMEPIRIDERWTLVLPTARAINPITKTNWEGTGVEPDVEVPAARALDEALKLAKQR